MKTLVLILLGIAAGWFIRATIDTAIERIDDWRVPARWAAFAIVDIIAVLVCDRMGIFSFFA